MSSQKKLPAEECSISGIEEFQAGSVTHPANSINLVEKVLEMYRRL